MHDSEHTLVGVVDFPVPVKRIQMSYLYFSVKYLRSREVFWGLHGEKNVVVSCIVSAPKPKKE